jgi:hypothetical protein
LLFEFHVGVRAAAVGQMKRLAGVKNGRSVLDNIESGAGNTIPLWLFGFLY